MDRETASGRRQTSSQTTPKVEVVDSQQSQHAIPAVTVEAFQTNHARTLPAEEGSPTESGSEHGDDTVRGHLPNGDDIEADTREQMDAICNDPNEPMAKFPWDDFVLEYADKIKATEQTEWHLRQELSKLVNVLGLLLFWRRGAHFDSSSMCG